MVRLMDHILMLQGVFREKVTSLADKEILYEATRDSCNQSLASLTKYTLERHGFTDLVETGDAVFDATKDGVRFKGISLTKLETTTSPGMTTCPENITTNFKFTAEKRERIGTCYICNLPMNLDIGCRTPECPNNCS
jgi:hypothetical protein